MITYFKSRRKSLPYRVLSAFVAFTFSFSYIVPPSSLYAQGLPSTVMNLPVPGTPVPLTPGFTPARIIGMTIHADNPLMFDFMVDPGDMKLNDQQTQDESLKLVKYFLASLTVPAEKLWVNLSPYEKDKIVPEEFGQTEMGAELLAQDYMLKQLTASLMNPEDELGKKFWDRVYEKAQKLFGTTEIPMNTFNKVWIVPEKAVVYANGLNVFILESRFKVMMEEDYLALQYHAAEHPDAGSKDAASGISSSIIKEVLLPEIEKEVNEGKTFANLRQIHNSLILAAWYKQNLKESLLGRIYADQGKTGGLTVQNKETSRKIYDQYVEAFQKGVHNFIKEDYDPATKQIIPRKYFSGGVTEAELKIEDRASVDPKILKAFANGAAGASVITAGVKSPGEEVSFKMPFPKTTPSAEPTSSPLNAARKSMFAEYSKKIGKLHLTSELKRKMTDLAMIRQISEFSVSDSVFEGVLEQSFVIGKVTEYGPSSRSEASFELISLFPLILKKASGQSLQIIQELVSLHKVVVSLGIGPPVGINKEFYEWVIENEPGTEIAGDLRLVKTLLEARDHFSPDDIVMLKREILGNNPPASSPVVSIERFHELLTGALADDGLEVKLRDTITVRLNENFVETHRDEFLDAIKILRQKILESSGEKLEDGLSYIRLAGAPGYHLEQRDALILIAVGSVLDLWRVFPNPENEELAQAMYQADSIGMFPMIDGVAVQKLKVPDESEGPVSSPVNISLLLETLESGDEAMRKAAANALGSVDSADPRIPGITKALDLALRLKNQSLDVRKAVARSLKRIGGRNFLVTAITSVNEDVRKAATEALDSAASLVVEGMTEEGDVWVDLTGKNLSTDKTSSPVRPFLTPAEFGELVKQGQVKTYGGIFSEELMLMLKNGTSIVGLFDEIEGDFLFYRTGGRFLDRNMEKLDVNAIESITLIARIPEDVLRSGLDLRNSQEKLRKIFSETEIIFVGLEGNPWHDNFFDLVVNYQAKASEEEKITDVIIPGYKSDPRVEIGAQAGLNIVTVERSYPSNISYYQKVIQDILDQNPHAKIVVYAQKELVAKQQFMPKGDPQDNLYDLFSKGHRVYSLSTKRGLMDGDSPYLDPLGMLAARLRVGITGDALVDLENSALGKTLTFRYTQRIRRWEWEINEVTFRTADFFDAYLVRPAQPWGGLQVFGDHTVELLAQLDDQRKEILTLFGTEGQRRLMVAAMLLKDKPTTPLRPIISGFWIEPGVTLEQVNSFIDGLAENDPWRSGLGLRLTNEIPAKTLDILKPTGGEGPTTPIKMDSLMFGDGQHYYLAMAVYPKEVSPGSTATIAVYADVQMSNLRLHYGFDASRNSGAWQQVDDRSFAEVDSDKPGLRKYQVSIPVPQDVTEVNLTPVDGFGNSIKDAMGKDLVINVERRLAEEAMEQAKGAASSPVGKMEGDELQELLRQLVAAETSEEVKEIKNRIMKVIKAIHPRKGVVRRADPRQSKLVLQQVDQLGAAETPEEVEEIKNRIVKAIQLLLEPVGESNPPTSSPLNEGPEKRGGIDLNPGNMDLRTNYGADRIRLPMPDIPLENIKIDGLVPFIIHVAPITNLPLLLGLADEPETDDAAGFQPRHSPIDAPRRFKARDIEEVGLLN